MPDIAVLKRLVQAINGDLGGTARNLLRKHGPITATDMATIDEPPVIHCAIASGRPHIVRLFLESPGLVDRSEMDAGGRQPVERALEGGNLEITRSLLFAQTPAQLDTSWKRYLWLASGVSDDFLKDVAGMIHSRAFSHLPASKFVSFVTDRKLRGKLRILLGVQNTKKLDK